MEYMVKYFLTWSTVKVFDKGLNVCVFVDCSILCTP